MEYNVDYFIKKFEEIPEEKWTTHVQQNDRGQRCAVGHCAPSNATCNMLGSNGGAVVEEGRALINIIGILRPNSSNKVAPINNGDDERYNQPTPKQRILAALYNIKKLQDGEATCKIKEVIRYVAVDAPIRKEAKELATTN